jgi:phage internal scaffolding protein
MSFYKRNEKGEIIRNRVRLVIPEDEPVLTEQSHKKEVDINNIVRKHGMDLIRKVAAMQEFEFDMNPHNDFQEMMNAMIKAKESFSSIPSEIRKQFDNDPAAFMDFVRNEENQQQLIDWGLANAPEPEPQPVQVEVVNPAPPDTP